MLLHYEYCVESWYTFSWQRCLTSNQAVITTFLVKYITVFDKVKSNGHCIMFPVVIKYYGHYNIYLNYVPIWTVILYGFPTLFISTTQRENNASISILSAASNLFQIKITSHNSSFFVYNVTV